MTLITAVLNSKGGVGKTTTSIHLATALDRNYSVEVWDADPQGSACEWAEVTAEDGRPLPFAVEAVNVRTLGSRRPDVDVVVIDTPPGEPALMTAAARRADVVIIPTAPANLDIARVWPTMDALGETPKVVLLTHADPRTVLYRQAREALDAEGVAVFDRAIRSTQRIKAQGNSYPTKMFGYDDVAAELMKLMKDGSR